MRYKSSTVRFCILFLALIFFQSSVSGELKINSHPLEGKWKLVDMNSTMKPSLGAGLLLLSFGKIDSSVFEFTSSQLMMYSKNNLLLSRVHYKLRDSSIFFYSKDKEVVKTKIMFPNNNRMTLSDDSSTYFFDKLH